MQSTMQSFDEILVKAGEFGLYQKKICLLGCIPGIAFAFLYVSVVFLGNTPRHWCRYPGAENLLEGCGWSEEKLGELMAGYGVFSGCHKFDLGWNSTEINCSDFHNDTIAFNSTRLVPCDGGWTFDQSVSTIVSEFQIVCDDAWKADLNQAFLNVGLLLGAVVFGYGADRYGRKLCFLLSVFGLGVSGTGMIFSPNYTVLLIIRTIQGIFGKGAWMSSYVLVTEIVGSNKRRLVGMMAQVFFTIGVILLPGIAYLVPFWKLLQLAITAPCFLLLTYYWLVPESPRWLFSMKRTKQATEVVKQMAKTNGKTFRKEDIEMIPVQFGFESNNPSNNASPLDIFKTPQMRKITLILMYAWFTSSVVYQGLVMRTGIIPGNLYLEFFIAGVVELPSAVLFYLTIDRVGRRIPLAVSNIVGGASCLATAFILDDWLKTAVAVIGRLAVTLGFEIVYLMSAELFPTPLRNLGVSVVSSFSDVGGMVAPFLLFRLTSIWTELPMCLYGVLCLIYGTFVLLLPETRGADLPETFEDIEALRSN